MKDVYIKFITQHYLLVGLDRDERDRTLPVSYAESLESSSSMTTWSIFLVLCIRKFFSSFGVFEQLGTHSELATVCAIAFGYLLLTVCSDIRCGDTLRHKIWSLKFVFFCLFVPLAYYLLSLWNEIGFFSLKFRFSKQKFN